MHFLALGLLLAALLYGPQLWTRFLLGRYGHERDDLALTGGELARRLIDENGLAGVTVERTEQGDHYDPEARAVRLLPQHQDRRSLAALAIAAHEVGHAIQHHRGESTFLLRGRMVQLAGKAERYGAFAITLMPVLAIVTRHPAPSLLLFLLGLASLAATVLVHFITLPVELDASFNKALPLLVGTDLIPKHDRPAVRRLLKAAAYTYVAASLSGLLNVWRWFRLLKR